MSIAFSLIKDKLGETNQVICQNPKQIVINFWLPDLPKKLSNEYLYFMNASQITNYIDTLDYKNIVLYVDGDIPPEIYESRYLNIVIVRSSLEYSNVKKVIQEMFDYQMRINNYASVLQLQCHTGSSIKTFLDTAYSYIMNPMILTDTSLVLIDQIGVYAEHNELIDYCLENKHMSSSLLEKIIGVYGTDFETEEIYEKPRVFEISLKSGANSRLYVCRIIKGTNLMGYLVLFEESHKINYEEIDAFRLLALTLAIRMNERQFNKPFSETQAEEFIIDLLNEKITDIDEIYNRCNYFGIDQNQRRILINVGLNAKKDSLDRLYQMKRKLQDILDTKYCVISKGNIIILCNEAAYIRHKNQFKQYLIDNGFFAGVSLSFSLMTDIQRAYKQALTYKKIRRDLNLTDNLIEYDTWKTFHLILNYRNICDLNQMVPDYLYRLKQFDTENNSTLLETLFAYIDSGRNAAETSVVLNVHYNTLKYRLKKIDEIVDIDLNDNETVFLIMLSSKIYRINKFE